MPLAVAVILQLVGVATVAAGLGLWVSPYAAMVVIGAVVFYVGLEGEGR